jgi:hypothetical protein
LAGLIFSWIQTLLTGDCQARVLSRLGQAYSFDVMAGVLRLRELVLDRGGWLAADLAAKAPVVERVVVFGRSARELKACRDRIGGAVNAGAGCFRGGAAISVGFHASVRGLSHL